MVKKNTKKTGSRIKRIFRGPTPVDDLKTAVLLVSVTINLAVFIGWLALKITTDYDAQVISFLFSR